jgi:hypothetical protein
MAVVGGLIAATLGILEAFQSRRLRERELRWKQAESGKHLIDEIFHESSSNAATLMLDSWDRTYMIASGSEVEIAWKDVLRALNVESFDKEDTKSVFIRDCFDMLFYYLDRFEHLIEAGLTTFEDVQLPIEYYVDMMAEHKVVIAAYIHACKYKKIWHFLNRFPAWVRPPKQK